MEEAVGTKTCVRESESAAVWRAALDNIQSLLVRCGLHTEVYRRSFDWLAAQRDHAPTLLELNAWLKETGWRVVYADGYVPVETYKALHSERIFPISRSLRRLRDLQHSAAPDFIHDVIGHLPMLFDPRYGALLQEWGVRGLACQQSDADKAVSQALSDLIAAQELDVVVAEQVQACTKALQAAHWAASASPSRNSRFETFYTWAIEYGMLRTDDGIRVIGAATLSSSGELSRVARGEVEFAPFDQAIGTMVNYTVVQNRMFVTTRFEEYFEVLRSL